MMSGGRDTFSEAILVHDPVRFLALWCFTAVKNQRLLHSHLTVSFGHVDGLICPCGFPVATRGSSVGPGAIGVLPVPWRKEIPFSLSEQRLICTRCTIKHHLLGHRLQFGDPLQVCYDMIALLSYVQTNPAARINSNSQDQKTALRIRTHLILLGRNTDKPRNGLVPPPPRAYAHVKVL